MLVASLGASVAYSTDVLFGKMALDEMPMFVFIFILALCYAILAVVMIVLKPDTLKNYLIEKQNIKPIGLAVIAVILGTIVADVLMWLAVKKSSRKQLPLAIAIIHTAPILSLILVCMFYKECLNWKANLGIVLMVLGGCMAIFYSGSSVTRIA